KVPGFLTLFSNDT
ncbi:hypothetical protein D047_4714B, partial [Vibrio parahaemolyticus VPTS-2010_2]